MIQIILPIINHSRRFQNFFVVFSTQVRRIALARAGQNNFQGNEINKIIYNDLSKRFTVQTIKQKHELIVDIQLFRLKK